MKNMLGLNKKMIDIVYSYPKLQERIAGRDEEYRKSLKVLKEIHASFSPWVAIPVIKFLDWTLANLYDGINLSFEEDLDLKRLVADHNVVFVPNHQSHADYIALNYIIYKKHRFPVYVAGGINLNLFFVGYLFRKCGCFFIRRSFSSDILYKVTLEAYLYFLLMEGKPIEFFFEGGRSRTGKLLEPRFGLYQMLLEAHKAIPQEKRKKFLFIPVSIVHEHIPDQKAMAKELLGGKKKKESFFQLIKLVDLFYAQFGSVHIRLGKPVELEEFGDIKETVQNLAFECFRAVGRNMLITPSALIALILLDSPAGALTLNEIVAKAKKIIHFCQQFAIPFTQSLRPEDLQKTVEHSLYIFLNNHRIKTIGDRGRNMVFYYVDQESRGDMLYYKNTGLHHFMVPWLINYAWINVFNGSVTDVQGLYGLMQQQLNHLRYEFYLPKESDFIRQTRDIISYFVGRRIDSFEECLTLSYKDFYTIAVNLGVFSQACHYIHQGYYLSALTVAAMGSEANSFKWEDYFARAREIFDVQRSLGRVIKYPESFSIPLLKQSLRYFTDIGLISMEGGQYMVIDKGRLDQLITDFERNLNAEITFSFRN